MIQAISIEAMVQRLKITWSAAAYMARRYQKAAKKRRIRNKWKNRFGPDFAIFLNDSHEEFVPSVDSTPYEGAIE